MPWLESIFASMFLLLIGGLFIFVLWSDKQTRMICKRTNGTLLQLGSHVACLTIKDGKIVRLR
jgi:hypothetical protein